MRSGVVAGVLLVSASLLGGCFDSDEVFKVAVAMTTGEPDPTTTSTTTVSSTDDDTTGTPMGDKTCIDAIDCVRACILALATSNLPEPDLSCFLDCTQELSEQEALKLLRLGNCVSTGCAEQGVCETPDGDTGGSSTDDGGSSSEGGGSSSEDGGSSTGDGGSSSSSTSGGEADNGGGGSGNPPAIDPCLFCILEGMLDPEPEGCVDLAESCRDRSS